MGAPAKSTGERNKPKAASGRKTRGSAHSKAEAKVESVPRDTPEPVSVSSVADSANKTTPTSRRARSIRSKTPSARASEAPSYSNRSARPKILEAARQTAQERGYERLKLADITDQAGISHQAFYGHFANKRHAVAVATSDELGAIADLATRGSKKDEEWALRMLEDIDRTLAQQYPATDGPERWLRDRICEAISTEGGFGSLRILELIKVSTLGHGEFYRRYGGKRGCLQRIYSDALDEIRSEIGEEPSIESLGYAIASDPDKAKLLILGSPHLPDRQAEEEGKSTQSSLLEMLSELIAAELGGEASDRHVLVIAGGVLEVIRSAVVSDSLGALPQELAVFELTGEAGTFSAALRLVA